MSKDNYTISNNKVYQDNQLIGTVVLKDRKKAKVLLNGTKNQYIYVKL